MESMSGIAVLVTFVLLVLFIFVPVFSANLYGPAIQFAVETIGIAAVIISIAWWLSTGLTREQS